MLFAIDGLELYTKLKQVTHQEVELNFFYDGILVRTISKGWRPKIFKLKYLAAYGFPPLNFWKRLIGHIFSVRFKAEDVQHLVEIMRLRIGRMLDAPTKFIADSQGFAIQFGYSRAIEIL